MYRFTIRAIVRNELKLHKQVVCRGANLAYIVAGGEGELLSRGGIFYVIIPGFVPGGAAIRSSDFRACFQPRRKREYQEWLKAVRLAKGIGFAIIIINFASQLVGKSRESCSIGVRTIKMSPQP